jgi:hypothetical protein
MIVLDFYNLHISLDRDRAPRLGPFVDNVDMHVPRSFRFVSLHAPTRDKPSVAIALSLLQPNY